jgi:GTP-binding protein
VGKSALFNRLAGRGISLVHPEPGVTRDRLIAPCYWEGTLLQLADTGGWEPANKYEPIAGLVQRELQEAINQAALLLFVVDARVGLTPSDEELAKWLRKSGRQILLVANKVDSPSLEGLANEFTRLGFGDPVLVSAAHGLGIQELKDRILARLSKEASPHRFSFPSGPPLRIAFVGKPNVGKSSLLNAILGESRLIVTEVPGTTRDAVDVPFRWQDREYLLIDTAGLKPRRKLCSELEAKTTGRSVHAIHRCQVAVLVLDALTGVTKQDKKIAGLIQRAHRPCLVVVNKWDLAAELRTASLDKESEYRRAVYRELFFLDFCPLLFASALKAEGIAQIFTALEEVQRERIRWLPEEELLAALRQAAEDQPPPRSEGRGNWRVLSLQYRPGQPADQRVPELHCTVTDPEAVTLPYQQYLERRLRAVFPLTGCPIRWVWKNPRAKA